VCAAAKRGATAPATSRAPRSCSSAATAATTFLAEDNLVHDSAGERYGLRAYSGPKVHGGLFRRNIVVHNSGIGMFYKVIGDLDKDGRRETTSSWTTPRTFRRRSPHHNTFRVWIPPLRRSLSRRWHGLFYLKDLKGDPRFADPSYYDYRLQSDSPAIGKGKDGGDLGALSLSRGNLLRCLYRR